MQLSLQYRLKLIDLLSDVWSSYSRWSLVLRQVIAIGILYESLSIVRSDGFDWLFVLFFVVATTIAFPHWYFLLAVWFFSGRREVMTRVVINEDGIHTECNEQTVDISWASLAESGSLSEYWHHFRLDCHQEHVLIPKRAFSSLAELAEFRDFARDRMGERCKVKTG